MLRLAVIGMNNPLSDEPEHALWTEPPGCAGHRLWQVASELTGIEPRQWLRLTDRQNLVVGQPWSVPVARRAAAELRPQLTGRTAIMLGSEVAAMFGLERGPLTWHETEDWLWMPHPSGRNLWWNCHAHREAAAIVMRDLIHETGWSGSLPPSETC